MSSFFVLSFLPLSLLSPLSSFLPALLAVSSLSFFTFPSVSYKERCVGVRQGSLRSAAASFLRVAAAFRSCTRSFSLFLSFTVPARPFPWDCMAVPLLRFGHSHSFVRFLRPAVHFAGRRRGSGSFCRSLSPRTLTPFACYRRRRLAGQSSLPVGWQQHQLRPWFQWWCV